MTSPSNYEFIGISGSGKSTLAKTAVRNIPDARAARDVYFESVMDGPAKNIMPLLLRLPGKIGRNVLRAYPRLRNRPVYSYHNFATEYPDFAQTVEQIIEEIEVDDHDRVRRLLIRRAVHYGAIKDEDSSIVFDEGFAMGAVSMFSRRNDEPEKRLVDQYMNVVPLPRILVHVDVRPEVGYQRARRRPEGLPSSMKKLSEYSRKKRFATMAKCVSTVGKLAEERGLTVVRIDNTGSLSNTKLTLIRELNSLARNQS
ncbi:hypothetical protein [Natronorarus salvus]|uniref:hypothetical protein n=1 Tax=Natronorarus salvus TaxID=3117733 RepID=UPI002F265A0F